MSAEGPSSARISEEDSLLGRLLVSQGLCSQEQVDECFSTLVRLIDEEIEPRPTLGELLTRKGYVSSELAQKTLKAEDRPAAPAPPDLPADASAAALDASNLYGKFVRVSRLGAGGMGEVWSAWDRELRRWVALKFMRTDDPNEVARFKREAQTAAALNHPNIASVYEVGEVRGTPYIAMQLIRGRSLHRYPGHDTRRVAQLVRDAALALHYAHGQGIVHRDLKPANLMVEGDDGRYHDRQSSRLYILDFGLAKSMTTDSRLSVSGTVVGTPAYMPPEQALGDVKKVGVRSDVYSLGATLYELLTSFPPFIEFDYYRMVTKVLHEDPKPVRKCAPKVDRDLETIVMKCMDKDPARRYPTALELAEDLGRWLDGEAIRAHPPSLAYRAKKYVARRRAVFGALAAGLGAVVAVLALVVPQWLDARADQRAAERRQTALKELAVLYSESRVIREWMRQPFRSSDQIRRELEKATGLVTDFIEGYPDLPEGYFVRARQLLYQGSLEKAEIDLNVALRLDPDFPAAWALMAEVRLIQYTQQLFASQLGAVRTAEEGPGGDFLTGAIEALEKAGRPGPKAHGHSALITRTREDETRATLIRALRMYYVGKRHDAAAALLRTAHAKEPSEYYCRWLAAWSDSLEEKLKWCDEAILIAPHYAPAYADRGFACLFKGEVDAAVKDFGKALERTGGCLGFHAVRGFALEKKGEFDRAIEDYEATLRHAPENWRYTPTVREWIARARKAREGGRR